MVQTVIKY